MCTFLHSSTYLVAPALKMKIAWNCILPPTYTLRILFFIYCHYKLGNDSMAFTINKHLYHRFRKVHLNLPRELLNMVWFAFNFEKDFCLWKYFFCHRYWASILQVLWAMKTISLVIFQFVKSTFLKNVCNVNCLYLHYFVSILFIFTKKSTNALLFVISFWYECIVK